MADDGDPKTDRELLLDLYEHLINVHGLIVDSVRIQQLDDAARADAFEEFAAEVKTSINAVAAGFRKLAEEVKRDGK